MEGLVRTYIQKNVQSRNKSIDEYIKVNCRMINIIRLLLISPNKSNNISAGKLGKKI